MNRPSWTEMFMAVAEVVSRRSIDPSTKHGCVLVDPSSNAVLGVGYNSAPRGMMDDHVPLDRPEKYYFFAHAEDNAVANAARHGVRLDGCVAYVTGMPCVDCIRRFINVGCKKVVYNKRRSVMIDDLHRKRIGQLVNRFSPSGACGNPAIILEEWDG